MIQSRTTPATTRAPSEILSDLAKLAARQAELTAELARALAAPSPRPEDAPPAYLTTAEAAEVLGVSTRTLEALRAVGKGPRYVRIGKSVRYPESTVRLPFDGDPCVPFSVASQPV